MGNFGDVWNRSLVMMRWQGGSRTSDRGQAGVGMDVGLRIEWGQTGLCGGVKQGLKGEGLGNESKREGRS